MSDKDRSYIWSVVIPTLRDGGATAEDVSNATGVNIRKVRRTLKVMDDMDWVDWPADDDGTFVPGDTAEEYLRE